MGIVENVRETVKLIQQIDNLELYRKVLDLQAEVMELVEENRRLKEQLDLRQQVEFKGHTYWRRGESGSPDGPYCPRCYDAEGLLVRFAIRSTHYPICPSCKMWVMHTRYES